MQRSGCNALLLLNMLHIVPRSYIESSGYQGRKVSSFQSFPEVVPFLSQALVVTVELCDVSAVIQET